MIDLESFSKSSFWLRLKNKLTIPINFFLSPIENFWLYNTDKEILKFFPPVFILGAPRSGTTILYQLLCKYFNFGFINNFVADFYRLPNAATSFYKKFFNEQNNISLESKFGQSQNLYGPNEFGSFWYQWFDNDHKLKKPISIIKKEILSGVSGLTKIHQKSILFKNVVNSMRVIQLNKIFDNPVFIVITRDELDTAQSILNARVKLYNDKNHLWSVMPSRIDNSEFEKPYWTQIIQQIRGVHFNIDLAKGAIGDDKFIFVEYSDLCNNTIKVLESIKDKLNYRGVNITSYDKSYPSRLNYSTGKKVSQSDYELLKNEIEKGV